MGRKHPRLANGMGSIKYLGKGRTNPYAVYAPEYRVTPHGSLSYSKPICYVPDWYTGFAVLVSYKAGTYKPGDEIDIARRMQETDEREMSYVARKILSDYRQIGRKEERKGSHLLKEVIDEYMEDRFGKYATKKYSEGTRETYQYAIKFWEGFFGRYIEDIKRSEIQSYVNQHSEAYSKNGMKVKLNVLQNVFTYAVKMEYISSSPCNVSIPMIAKEESHAHPYTEDELKVLWAHKEDEEARSILVQCYSGFRIGAFYDNFIVDKKNLTFTGGVKTGRRTIPVHSCLVPLLSDPIVCWGSKEHASRDIGIYCEKIGIPKHTSHSARHTFKMLCDRYGVNPLVQRVLMGHKLNTDVHDSAYTHFEIEDLRREIEKIDAVCCQ